MDNICPYLGMMDDPKTSTLFPDNCNACQRPPQPKPVVLTHQRAFCLAAQHTECEGFVHGWQEGFPNALRNKNCRQAAGFWKNMRTKLPSTWIIVGSLLTALVLVAVFLAVPNLGPAPAITPEGGIAAVDSMATETQQALAAMLTPTETPTHTATSTPTPEPTHTPTPDFTPTQTPGPGLSTPFGDPDFQLLVHEVQEQETVTAIANQYNTTVDVLWILNGLTFRTIRAGDPIVVCLGCTEILDLPPLQPVYLEQGTTLTDLSNEYDAVIDDLRAWNGLGDGDWIEGGRWIVVPLEVDRS